MPLRWPRNQGQAVLKRHTDEIVKRLSDKEPRASIARSLGVGLTSLARFMQRNGLEAKKVKADDLERKMERAVDLYVNEKVAYQRVAKMLHVDPSHLRSALVGRGVKLRPYRVSLKTEEMLATDYVHGGLTKRDILRKHDVDENVLRRVIRERGLQRLVPAPEMNPWKLAGCRTPYQVWVDKHGKEEADRRMALAKERMSRNSSKYGKPPVQGCGKSWQGWYKDVYFRSLKELAYMMTELEREGLQWVNAERKEFMACYVGLDGRPHTYRADFIIWSDRLMVEIKPKSLWESPLVKLKREAGEAKCRELGLTYVLIDPVVNTKRMLAAYQAGHIKWIEHTRVRFERRHGKELGLL